MTVALLVHAASSVHAAYAQALDCQVFGANSSGSQFSAGYDERTGMARDCPTLDAAMRRYAPSVPADEPVILIGFSAGCWAVRAWLREPDARLRTVAAVFLDGLHSSKAGPLSGVLDYARMVIDQPLKRACVITHSQIVPPYTSTRATAEVILRELHLLRDPQDNATIGGLHLLSYPGADAAAHVRQLRSVGPEVCQRIVAPLVTSRATTEPQLVSPALSLGERALAWSVAEMRQRPAPDASRRAEYFGPCVREQGGTLKALGIRDGNWCAAGACFAARQVTQDGDTVPHLYRASGIELERDAVRAGSWLSIDEARALPEAVHPGDLVILHRGAPGSWTRHVGRVSTAPNEAGEFECVDANGPGWKRATRVLTQERIRGFVRYPRAAEMPTGHDDPELDRLLALAQHQSIGLDWESWPEDRDA